MHTLTDKRFARATARTARTTMPTGTQSTMTSRGVPASEAQLRYLRKLAADNPAILHATLTRQQASELIAQLRTPQ